MKRLLAALAAASTLLVAGAASAPATPADGGRLPIKPAPATQIWATRALSSQPGQQPQQLLRLDVEELTPRVITSDGPDSVTVRGKVVNVGDRDVTDIELRLERGDALRTEEQVRSALREPADAEVVQPQFTRIVEELPQGQSAPFSLTVPLRGGERSSLEIEQPGIYPILANINGVPEYGGRARLAALSTLLPVLSVPGGAVQGPSGNQAKLTLLWPLADEPKLVQVAAGGGTELVDDELASSLALGGRLYGLLKGYEAALDSPLAPAVCVAVDPDLLRTVAAMTEGYQVRGRGAGAGQRDAELWLDLLRRLVAGRCVVALPDADADLVALSRAGRGDLGGLAVAGAGLVQELLEVQPLPKLVWPEDGVVDQGTLADLTAHGVTSLVLDQSAVAGTPGAGPVLVGGDRAVTAVRIDAMVSDALHGGSPAQALGGVATPTEALPVSVQNALAALTYRAAFQGTGQNVVIAPPRRWNAPTGEVGAFLETAEALVAGQFAAPTGLEGLVGGTPPEQTAALSYPVEAGAREVTPEVVASVGQSWLELQDVAGAMSQEDAGSAAPEDLVDPLRLGLLRAVSGAWRGDAQGARAALALARDRIDGLRSQVTVTEPGSPILLGSGDSPIPVTVKNRLDVRVTVRIVVEDTPGIEVKQLADQVLPARGDRLISVPVEVLRSGRFSVHVKLATPSGVELGDRARLEVSSSAYGTITVVITALAGALLVLLSARRIYRRVRAAKAAEAAAAPAQRNDLAEDPAPEPLHSPAEETAAPAPEKSSTS
ncbi:DUF6049 family protein [Saccharothrix coeruleofusca]|uniref:Glycoprotein n=1 Tax=Saccharothrix coeruleofusca TaxID=33919 RepID=A0A918AH30_9PSEU|nr:DUF6049 family protein [Saccharothrix coeruleofusca]GGP38531.1 glycoprotein [Saccharothrix coeruleofusca]